MERVVNKELIEKQAKLIIDKFAVQLEKVEKEIDEESFVEREEFERIEGKASSDFSKSEDSKIPSKVDNNFKNDMLKNAPNHDDDFIIAEKGSWK